MHRDLLLTEPINRHHVLKANLIIVRVDHHPVYSLSHIYVRIPLNVSLGVVQVANGSDLFIVARLLHIEVEANRLCCILVTH